MAESMKPKPWFAYVAPMAIYMAFLLAQSNANLVWVYPAKIVAVAAALIYFRKQYDELRPNVSLLAVLVGLVAIAVWIGIDPLYHHLGHAMPFDPTTIGSVAQRSLFITFRVVGAVIVVPVMEELFWRAFLIRWLVNEDFKSVPVGMFTWTSFGVTVALFGAEHSEWLAGLICGALYNWLYYKRKDVFSCVVAHVVSNAALAAWVLARGDWRFW
jgi:CAAX prenyl protease-like protein